MQQDRGNTFFVIKLSKLIWSQFLKLYFQPNYARIMIMPALCSYAFRSRYAQNYAGIIRKTLVHVHVYTKQFVLKNIR